MKIYQDLINYAENLTKDTVYFWEHEKLEKVLGLPYGFLSEVETDFTQIKETNIVSTNVGESCYRTFSCSVFYFENKPFVIYNWGGRSTSDFEEVLVINVDVDWFVNQQFIPLPTPRYLYATEGFQGRLEQKNYWDGEDYSCTLFFYNSKPFLVKDAYDDSEDCWDEDSEIIDKRVASEFVKEILEVYKNFYLKLIEEDF